MLLNEERSSEVDIKRFMNQDVIVGSVESSPSLNRYAYVEGNPVNYLDPFGLEKESYDLPTENLHQQLNYLSNALMFISLVLVGISIVVPEAIPVSLLTEGL